MKRIHGKLLIVCGILHTAFAIIPGVFGEQFMEFAKIGFFNISEGIGAFPLFDGKLNYDNFAAFWFFYAGLFMLVMGLAVDYIEKTKGRLPLRLSVGFLIFSLIGAFMIPFSGMTIFLLPQAVYMLIRTKRNSEDRLSVAK